MEKKGGKRKNNQCPPPPEKRSLFCALCMGGQREEDGFCFEEVHRRRRQTIFGGGSLQPSSKKARFLLLLLLFGPRHRFPPLFPLPPPLNEFPWQKGGFGLLGLQQGEGGLGRRRTYTTHTKQGGRQGTKHGRRRRTEGQTLGKDEEKEKRGIHQLL